MASESKVIIGPAASPLVPIEEARLGLRPLSEGDRDRIAAAMPAGVRLAEPTTAVLHNGQWYAPDAPEDRRMVPVDAFSHDQLIEADAVAPTPWVDLEEGRTGIELAGLKGMTPAILQQLEGEGVSTIEALADCDMFDLMGADYPDAGILTGVVTPNEAGLLIMRARIAIGLI